MQFRISSVRKHKNNYTQDNEHYDTPYNYFCQPIEWQTNYSRYIIYYIPIHSCLPVIQSFRIRIVGYCTNSEKE